jgi:hypothetical protein
MTISLTDPSALKVPREWIEARDIENLSFEKATWIPLVISKTDFEKGRSGHVGYRRVYRSFESIIVPLGLRDQFEKVDWQSVMHHGSDGAWADENEFHPPGSYDGDSRVLYPVLQRSFETGEPIQWDMLQELEVGLKLFRIGDQWVRPEENDLEVATLERNSTGRPEVVRIRAEHLRDYLCAKKAALLLTGFCVREAVEQKFPGLRWKSNRRDRHFEGGEWEGTCMPIHEGGQPYKTKRASRNNLYNFYRCG